MTVFIEMVCATQAVDNPMTQPPGAGGGRSILVPHEGELEAEEGEKKVEKTEKILCE